METNIISIGGFIFFILLLLPGYLMIEYSWGNNFRGRDHFEKYNNRVFDRTIIYIFISILINSLALILLFAYLYFFSGEWLINIKNDGISDLNRVLNTNEKEITLFVNGIMYFTLLIFTTLILIIIKYITIMTKIIIKYIVKITKIQYTQNIIFNIKEYVSKKMKNNNK